MGEEPRLSRAANLKRGRLWVGGRMTVTDRAVRFSPNRSNELLHGGGDGRLEVELPLAQVDRVGHRRGVLTGIVVLGAGEREVLLRCWGARDVARQVQELVDRV